ncbi:hypothetical protein SB816_32340, partial [Achromobacter sp. SIMBA_011]|uniref:hypothetical protein n=1 Tax=Achromobacter sp. SIMBA_011 TaxID=3085759 RepID=UPI00397C9F52
SRDSIDQRCACFDMGSDIAMSRTAASPLNCLTQRENFVDECLLLMPRILQRDDLRIDVAAQVDKPIDASGVHGTAGAAISFEMRDLRF